MAFARFVRHAGRGWDETIKNFRHSSYGDLVLNDAYNKLFTAIKSHTYVGNQILHRLPREKI